MDLDWLSWFSVQLSVCLVCMCVYVGRQAGVRTETEIRQDSRAGATAGHSLWSLEPQSSRKIPLDFPLVLHLQRTPLLSVCSSPHVAY